VAELVALLPDPAPLPGVERPDLSVLRIRRLRRFGPDLPRLGPRPAALGVGDAAFSEGLVVAAPAPGEWLVLGPCAAVAELARLQDPAAFLAVEIGEACATLRLAPHLAAIALAAHCPIDPASLRPGRATRSLFADTTVLLLPEPGGMLLLLVGSAAADHVLALLALLTPDT
jgi:sarcosine oxidase gamma subunit